MSDYVTVDAVVADTDASAKRKLDATDGTIFLYFFSLLCLTKKIEESKRARTSKQAYWAVYYICEEPILTVTFVPKDDLEIDFDGDVWSQVRDFMEECDAEYFSLDTVQKPKQVAQMFTEYSCTPVTYGFE